MTVREFLQKHSRLMIGIALAVIALFAVVIGNQLRNPAGARLPVFPDQQFFTTDDGATWFADNSSNIPPFDHNGQEAVSAFVFTCDGGQTKFVQFLEKFSDKARQEIVSPQSDSKGRNGPLTDKLVKKPGEKKWILESSPMGQLLIKPKCPDGLAGVPQLVTP